MLFAYPQWRFFTASSENIPVCKLAEGVGGFRCKNEKEKRKIGAGRVAVFEGKGK